MKESIATDSSQFEVSASSSLGWGMYLVGFIALVILWALASLIVDSKVFMPSPIRVSEALYSLAGEGRLQAEVWASFTRVLAGFGLGAACGLVAGIVIGLAKRVEEALEPAIELFR